MTEQQDAEIPPVATHGAGAMIHRTLFFDIWRIVAISFVIIQHLVGTIHPESWLVATYGPLGGISGITGLGGNLGNIGVELFIILSGCVLEYRYGEGLLDYFQFIKKRVVHIYPAYWLSLILAFALYPVTLGIIELLETVSGFWIFKTINDSIPGVQPLNPMGWFIGLIIILYLLYPVLSDFLHQYRWALFWILVISVVTRVILLLLFPHGNEWYWFPVSRIFEFSLGIWLVQEGYYVKTLHENKVITFLSNVSFPVFLTHIILLPVLLVYGLPLYVVAVGVISTLFLIINNRFYQFIRN